MPPPPRILKSTRSSFLAFFCISGRSTGAPDVNGVHIDLLLFNVVLYVSQRKWTVNLHVLHYFDILLRSRLDNLFYWPVCSLFIIVRALYRL